MSSKIGWRMVWIRHLKRWRGSCTGLLIGDCRGCGRDIAHKKACPMTILFIFWVGSFIFILIMKGHRDDKKWTTGDNKQI